MQVKFRKKNHFDTQLFGAEKNRFFDWSAAHGAVSPQATFP